MDSDGLERCGGRRRFADLGATHTFIEILHLEHEYM